MGLAQDVTGGFWNYDLGNEFFGLCIYKEENQVIVMCFEVLEKRSFTFNKF